MSLKKIVNWAVAFAILGFSFCLNAETLGVYKTESGAGWLEKTGNGQLILHLKGTYYEMGYQQGKLLKNECLLTMNSVKGLLRDYLPIAPFGLTRKLLYRYIYQKEAPYIPPEFQEEMKGLADATGAKLKDIQALHSMIFLASCSASAAYGKASKDGSLYQTRSLDYPLNFIDRKTGTPLQNQNLIVVYQPQSGVPYINLTWPGFLGSVGGMNARKISVSEMTDDSRYESRAGLPMIFRIKQTLSRAESLDQAVALMTQGALEGGYNFIVGDGKIPKAMVLEMDAKSVYLGSWDGPAESNSYYYGRKKYQYHSAEGLLVRTNHPLSKDLISNHTGPIEGAKGESGNRFWDLQARLEKEYGSLDLIRMMEIMREHYQAMCGAPDFEDCSSTIYQAAFAPGTGDFLYASAYGNPKKESEFKVSAYNQPYQKYNLYELLQRKP